MSTIPLARPGPLAVIGHPIGHSLSPVIHRTALAAIGRDPAYSAYDVAPDDLASAVAGLRALGFAGANVTVPHKRRVSALCDRLGTTAASIGAVNTIVIAPDGLLYGDNTDVAGFLDPLEAHAARSAVVLGAGGAARAVVYALLSRPGLASLAIAARRPDQARALMASMRDLPTGIDLAVTDLAGVGAHVSSADLVVNTTPVGMHPDADADPLDPAIRFRADQVVYDLVYRPRTTRLLARAAADGATTIPGLPMLVGQAAESFRMWTGEAMPLDPVYEALASLSF